MKVSGGFASNRVSEVSASGWYHLVPFGEHPLRVHEGELVKTVVQVVDAAAAKKIVTAFNRKKSVDPSYLMLVDFEHFSHDTKKSSEAAGWVDAMEVRKNGVWGRIVLSDKGEAAIQNKRYRSISPVWFPHQTEPLGENRFRPVEINDAGFTNHANLSGLTPFWNRGIPETSIKNMKIKELIKLLGLDEDASEESAIAAVEALQKRVADADEAKKAVAEKYESLKKRHSTLLSTTAGQMKEPLMNRVREIQYAAGISRDDALVRAAEENPEAYTAYRRTLGGGEES